MNPDFTENWETRYQMRLTGTDSELKESKKKTSENSSTAEQMV